MDLQAMRGVSSSSGFLVGNQLGMRCFEMSVVLVTSQWRISTLNWNLGSANVESTGEARIWWLPMTKHAPESGTFKNWDWLLSRGESEVYITRYC